MGSAFRHKSIRYRPIMQEKNDPVIRHGFAWERRRVFVCSARRDVGIAPYGTVQNLKPAFLIPNS